MSNELAIGAVTATLRNLLESVKELSRLPLSGNIPSGFSLTTEIVINNLPPNEAHDFDNTKNQVNLFLYQIERSAAWRNSPIPGSVKNGESGHPPLALNLYYMITTYGQGKNEIIGHLLLGKAMSILHDHSLLSREEIESAFPGSRLHEQIERVRITPQPVSSDDLSKLWTGFQSQYKLSVAYQVAVVLIESKRPARTPLPVLTRGANDTGISVQLFVIPPFPALESVLYPRSQHGVQLGDELILKGHNLRDSINIRFKHLMTGIEISRPPGAGLTDQGVKFVIPANETSIWPAGLYSVKVETKKLNERIKTSNDIGFVLVPTIGSIVVVPLSPPGSKSYSVAITFLPKIHLKQKAYLLLGDREFKARDQSIITDRLDFELKNVEDGQYYVRLRIDGADSLLIVDTVTPPVFNPAHQIALPVI